VGTITVLLGILLVVATAMCGVAIWALTEGVKTARSMRILADNLDEHAMPLIEKADVTVDALNIELLRIDQIVTSAEEITDRVQSTSRTVQEVANAPAEIVTDIADRVRRAWKRRQAEHASGGADNRPAPDVEQDLGDVAEDADNTERLEEASEKE